MTTIRLEGVPNANRKLDDTDDIGDMLRKPMDKALFKLQNRMAMYPPPPPGSTYRRTGTLGRRWTTGRREIPIANSQRIEGRVGNNTSYGPFVQAKQFQHRIHRGRWPDDEQVAKEETPWIERQFNKAMDDAAED